MSKKEKIPVNNHAGDVPLLDEVQLLLEKERLLLELKFLEQQKEAQEWKSKYDMIVEKVHLAAVVSGDTKAVEQVVHIDDKSNEEVTGGYKSRGASGGPITSDRMNDILMSLGSNWILDCSNNVMTNGALTMLLKGPTAITHAHPDLKIFRFTNCSIDDSTSQLISAVVSKQSVLAVDLSNNNLGKDFENQLIDALKLRKRSPQYVLLHGNMPLGASSKTFINVIRALTDSTWGISVSLQDFSQIAHDSLSSASKNKTSATTTPRSARGKTNELAHINDTSNHPKFAYEFVKNLLLHLDPNATIEAENVHPGHMSPKKKIVKTKSTKVSAPVKLDGMQNIQVFGLSYSQLSKNTVKLVEKVCITACATLTELDLSFSYIGCSGAACIASLLKRKGCQLIHINLAGNAIGDFGLNTVSKSMAKNRTLTYLDIRSNNISDVGLHALASALYKSRTIALVDIRCNHITSNSVHLVNKALVDNGSFTILRHNSSTVVNFTSNPNDTGGNIIYERPFSSKAPISYNLDGCGTAKLYIVDVKYINSHFKYTKGQPLFVDWAFRPFDNETFASIRPPLRWEVVVNSILGDFVADSGTIGATQCHGSDLKSTDWARCRATIKDLPVKGTVEILIKTENRDSSRTHHSKGKFAPTLVAVESINFKISYVRNTDKGAYIGGDCTLVSDRVNELNSKYRLDSNHVPSFIPKGYKVLRVLQYHGESTDASFILSWSSKLLIDSTSNIDDNDDQGASYDNKVTVGYEWCLIVVTGTDLFAEIVAQGECNNDSLKKSELTLASLRPWKWESYSIPIPKLLTNDVIYVAARPISSGGSVSFLKSCEVTAKECKLSASNNIFTINTYGHGKSSKYGSIYDVVSDGNSMSATSAVPYAVHNDNRFIHLPL